MIAFLLQRRCLTRNTTREKPPEVINQELLASIIEIADEYYSGLSKEMKNLMEPKEALSIIKKYNELLKGENRKIINLVGNQGKLLKKFKKNDEFFRHVGLSQTNIYF